MLETSNAVSSDDPIITAEVQDAKSPSMSGSTITPVEETDEKLGVGVGNEKERDGLGEENAEKQRVEDKAGLKENG